MRIRFACYKFAPTIVSSGIRWWSHSLYSHVAIIAEWENHILLFEALSEGFVRTGGLDLGKILKAHHAEPGIVVDVFNYADGSHPRDHADAANYLEKLVGQKYDFEGIASFVTGAAIPENPTRVFCSEAAAEASRAAGVLLQNCPSKNLMPRDIAMSLALEYAESVNLDDV